jgi:sucrose-6-phosphate hydrolase SacC (GH32 family)
VLKVNGSYWMWYTAAGWESPIAIGLAASPDGVSWSRVGDAPVLVNPQGTHQFSDPHVIRDAGMFKMWVGNFTDSVIYYAESPDGVDWSEPIPALLPGTR